MATREYPFVCSIPHLLRSFVAPVADTSHRFLWKTNSFIPDPQVEKDEDDLPIIDVFKWTGRNDYVALCEPDFVSIGGG